MNALKQPIISRSSPKVSGYLRVIEGSSMRAAGLCKQMLAYSGQGHFIVKPLSLTNEINSMKELLHSSVSNKIELVYMLDEQLARVMADKTQIDQIMLNLVLNASEAIEETGRASGKITISTTSLYANAEYFTHYRSDSDLPDGTYACLEISDDGCGMNDKTLAKIYDPFFTTKFTGRGLGMSAIRGIVRGHKGAIRIYSEVGRGSVFRLLFPCVDMQAEPAKHHTTSLYDSAFIARFGQGKTVLVVDDEAMVCKLLDGLLSRMGFKVLIAADGQQGLALFNKRQHDIALVILDYAMPVMDGAECFVGMQAVQPDVKVLLSSGYNEDDATGRFANDALAGFIQKPYLTKDFEQKVIEILTSVG